MGYILPHTSYQDFQYRLRDNKTQYHVLKTNAIAPIKPISSEANFNHGSNQHRAAYKNLEAEKILKDLTGKGHYFNELI